MLLREVSYLFLFNIEWVQYLSFLCQACSRGRILITPYENIGRRETIAKLMNWTATTDIQGEGSRHELNIGLKRVQTLGTPPYDDRRWYNSRTHKRGGLESAVQPVRVLFTLFVRGPCGPYQFKCKFYTCLKYTFKFYSSCEIMLAVFLTWKSRRKWTTYLKQENKYISKICMKFNIKYGIFISIRIATL